MFDTNWIRAAMLVSYLNELATAMENGLHPFSKCNPSNYDAWHDGLVYVDDEATDTHFAPGTVVADKCIDECHHDAISAWGDVLKHQCGCDANVYAEKDEDAPDGDPWVVVRIQDGPENVDFVVDPGRWYFCP